MPQISVIVPVYNTEKYVEKCILSILNQKNKNIELIIVNDGSTDNSEKIIEKFLAQYPEIIKYYKKENGGLSDARNYGVSKAMGDYLCFVDSDDFIDENLFANLEKYILQGIDLIKYKCVRISEDYENRKVAENIKIIEYRENTENNLSDFTEKDRINNQDNVNSSNKINSLNYTKIIKNLDGDQLSNCINGPVFECKSGEDAFNELFPSDVLLEAAWLYLYKKSFWDKNNFAFPIKNYHEDWAIVPFIILMAKTVVSTNIYGYYYVQSTNSITRNNDDEKTLKRAYDMLEHYDNLLKMTYNANLETRTINNFKIYMSNCIILKLAELPIKYHKQYIKEIKKRKIVNNFKITDLKQFIKKILLKINIELYLKITNRG